MSYALIMGRKGTEKAGAIRTISVEGERAMPVFESARAAERYSMLSGYGLEWAVVDDPDGDFERLLREAVAPRVGYVTIDPPVALKGAPPPAVSLIPIERFLEDC